MRGFRKMAAICTGGILMAAMARPVCADGLDLSGADLSGHGAEQSAVAEEFRQDMGERGIFDTGSTDVVTITEDGRYNVQADGLNMIMYPPFGWLCVTQDMAQQLELFTLLYVDPVASATGMVEDNTHFVLVDSGVTRAMEIHTYSDSFSKVIGNSNDLSASDEAVVLNTLRDVSYTGSDASTMTLGENRYYRFVDPSGQAVYYETYVNSVLIQCICFSIDSTPLTSTDLTDFELALADFSIG